MFKTINLILPALVPSWRFFDVIAPSPRIDYVLLKTAHDQPTLWQELRPRPEKVSIGQMFGRLFFNPSWNESLFLTSCAERLIDHPTPHSHIEIFDRIAADIRQQSVAFMQFRLRTISRHSEDIVYTSPIQSIRP